MLASHELQRQTRPRLYKPRRLVLVDPLSFWVGLAVGSGAVLAAVALVALRGIV